MRKVHYFQHVAFETPQNIYGYFQHNDYAPSFTKFYKDNYQLPRLEEVDILVVMGGPMGVYDTDIYPWLATELAFISDCIESGIKVIGICLGSQFIAKAMGAEVYAGTQKEIGWYPISVTYKDISKDVTVFHWHGDTFHLPKGVQRIASSECTTNQGFYNDHVLALQFHVEMTQAGVETIVSECGSELEVDEQYVSSAKEILAEKSYFATNEKLLIELLDDFIG